MADPTILSKQNLIAEIETHAFILSNNYEELNKILALTFIKDGVLENQNTDREVLDLIIEKFKNPRSGILNTSIIDANILSKMLSHPNISIETIDKILSITPRGVLDSIKTQIISNDKINVDTLVKVLVQLKFEKSILSEKFLKNELIQSEADFKKLYEKIIITQKDNLDSEFIREILNNQFFNRDNLVNFITFLNNYRQDLVHDAIKCIFDNRLENQAFFDEVLSTYILSGNTSRENEDIRNKIIDSQLFNSDTAKTIFDTLGENTNQAIIYKILDRREDLNEQMKNVLDLTIIYGSIILSRGVNFLTSVIEQVMQERQQEEQIAHSFEESFEETRVAMADRSTQDGDNIECRIGGFESKLDGIFYFFLLNPVSDDNEKLEKIRENLKILEELLKDDKNRKNEIREIVKKITSDFTNLNSEDKEYIEDAFRSQEAIKHKLNKYSGEIKLGDLIHRVVTKDLTMQHDI